MLSTLFLISTQFTVLCFQNRIRNANVTQGKHMTASDDFE